MASATAVAHQVARAALADRTARLVRAFWDRADQHNIAASWARLVPQVAELIASGQYEAAQATNPYLAQVLGELTPEAEVQPAAFAGVAPDGRPLHGLLMYPVWATLRALKAGASLAAAWVSGAALLDLITRTVIADTGRQADQAGMVATLDVTGYVRVVELPACSRCIILAGTVYPTSEGFARHPRCDCTMEPITRGHTAKPLNDDQLFESMTAAQQNRTFGEAGAQAIRDGADIAQVVNARRGMNELRAGSARALVTTEGITRRGFAGQRMRNFTAGRPQGQRYRVSRTPRHMPEEIYERANGDRAEAIAQLRRFGYVA